LILLILRFFIILAFLVASSSSTLLDCEFNYHDWAGFWSDGGHYVCDVKNLFVSEPNMKFSSLETSEHLDNRTNEDVLGVKLRHQNAFRIISGFEKFFPNAVEFYIFESNLQKIERSDFKDLTFVKVLSFYVNKIQHVPADTFQDMVNLEYLSLSYNNIQTYPSDVFHSLVSLKGIYLHGTGMTKLQHDLLEKNTKLEDIWLQDNKLVEIDGETFGLMKNLEHVNLERNDCINREYSSLNTNGRTKSMQEYVNSVCGVKRAEEKDEIMTCRAELAELKRENGILRVKRLHTFAPNHINANE
jgi:Leucine rich repeat